MSRRSSGETALLRFVEKPAFPVLVLTFCGVLRLVVGDSERDDCNGNNSQSESAFNESHFTLKKGVEKNDREG